MDVRVLLTALATVVLVALCHATSDQDHDVQLIDDHILENDVADDVMFDDKRATKIFRYGRAPGVFRYGKRAPSVFRYGKRAPAVFRYGRRSDDGSDDALMLFAEPAEFESPAAAAHHNKRKIFRWGKRADE